MFAEAANLSLLQKRYSDVDSTNNYYYLEDTGGGDEYFGGYYNSSSKQYEFRITRFMKDYIAGKFDTDNILLQIVGSTNKGYRLIGGGYDPDVNPESRIRLEMIYTELESETP